MRSIVLNVTFVAGVACVQYAAFMLSIPLGLLSIGVPLIALSIHIQGKVKK